MLSSKSLDVACSRSVSGLAQTVYFLSIEITSQKSSDIAFLSPIYAFTIYAFLFGRWFPGLVVHTGRKTLQLDLQLLILLVKIDSVFV